MKPDRELSQRDKDKVGEPNLDPLTGAPGAHPVGTGIGAAAGGATGAAIGAAGGPVGAVIGTVVGAVAGGLAGKGVAEGIDPTAEMAYWKENHARQPYAKDRPYESYDSAYRAGVTSYADDRSFDEAEADIRANYESSRAENTRRADATRDELQWEDARHASRAAWNRLAESRKAPPPATGGPIPIAP